MKWNPSEGFILPTTPSRVEGCCAKVVSREDSAHTDDNNGMVFGVILLSSSSHRIGTRGIKS